ncbi:MAG: transposase [Rickettsia endosymbiont of Argas persicus]
MVTELKNRGVEQIYVACVDGLKGFPEAINSVFPKTIVQLCIVHMIRNSVKYVSYKDLKSVIADLKKIYSAINEAEALRELQSFSKKWDNKYPVIFDIWQRNWPGIAPFLASRMKSEKQFIRLMLLNQLIVKSEKLSRIKGLFPDDKSIQKIIFLALTNASKKWTMPIKNWAMALNQFAILCDTNLQNWANGEILLTQRI